MREVEAVEVGFEVGVEDNAVASLVVDFVNAVLVDMVTLVVI
jgi:hypothetical protein